jgi:tetratricopeptide (TPR) repeat protein/tRNA A-37 threonylcarbamoyl transferase component Bud32
MLDFVVQTTGGGPGPEKWDDRVRERLNEQARRPDRSPSFRLSRYELQECIGEGATALVYAAWDQELKRNVAIKVLRDVVGMSEIARERFRREAQAAAALSHSHLVAVYDAGTVDGQAYLVMERVQGHSLDDYLRERRPDLRSIATIVERAARGVAAAHEKGIVHRDLKPANILVSSSGDPKVGDFGMAHLMDSQMELTRTGVALGTPLYMAPEQVEGRHQDITPRTDVYGLGAILYELLSDRPPHVADSIVELYGKIAREEPVPPRKWNPKMPPELEAITLKALEKDPSRRYPTAAEFADDLARFLDGRLVQARRISPLQRLLRRLRHHRGMLSAAAAALALILGVAYAGQRRARALEETRLREREAADLRLRQASQSSLEVSLAREKSLRRLSTLWGRMVAVQEWRKQASRKPAEIREELQGILSDATSYIAEYPDMAQGYYVRARAQFFVGNTLAAESDLTRALEAHPDFSPGWALLAQVKLDIYYNRIYGWSRRVRAAKRAEAEPILREAQEAFRRYDGGTPGKVASERWGLSWSREDAMNEVLIPALREVYLEKNLEAAKARLEKAQAESPAAEYCDFLGVWMGFSKLSLPYYDQAVALAPHWSRPYLDRGVVLSWLGDREKAILDFTRAIELNPKLAIAYDNRAYNLILMKKYDEAIRDCDRALEADPRMDSALMHRALARHEKKDFQEAIRDCSESISLRPDCSTSWAIRGICRREIGELESAGSDLDRAIELDPDEPDYYYHRALLCRLRKDFERMAQDCEKALKLAPPDWDERSACEQLRAEAKHP